MSIADLTDSTAPALTDPIDVPADAQVVLDVLPDPAIVVGPDQTVAYANAAAREHFGRLEIGAPLLFITRKPELIEAVEEVARTGRGTRARWSQRGLVLRWYEGFVAPLPLPGTSEKLITIIIRDLTEQKRTDKMRKDFIANASHELRTPLSVLTAFIETLQGAARDDEASRDKFLGIMREHADRMRRLTEALLSLSRVEMRAHIKPTDQIDLGSVAKYAVELTQPLADESGVVLEVHQDVKTLPVIGDFDELVQVVENIIENAVNYGGDGGRVVVRAFVSSVGGTGAHACVAVQDFGEGVPPEHVPRITERFYRIDKLRSREKRGTGLGLAIAKHIVSRHGGRLAVRSEVKKGSTFTVQIPLNSTQTDV